MASGAKPEVGNIKAVADEQLSESMSFANEALPASSSMFFHARWSSVSADRSGRCRSFLSSWEAISNLKAP